MGSIEGNLAMLFLKKSYIFSGIKKIFPNINVMTFPLIIPGYSTNSGNEFYGLGIVIIQQFIKSCLEINQFIIQVQLNNLNKIIKKKEIPPVLAMLLYYNFYPEKIPCPKRKYIVLADIFDDYNQRIILNRWYPNWYSTVIYIVCRKI